MYQRGDKYFHFWVFAPNSHRVHKIKMSKKLVTVILSIMFLALGYTLYNSKALFDVYNAYRYTLSMEDSNQKLAAILKRLEEQNSDLRFKQSKIDGYENELAIRMVQLESIIQAASKLNMLSHAESDSRNSNKNSGQGGLEISCVGDRCNQPKASYNRYTKLITMDSMLARAESYSETLSKIPFLSPVQSHVTSHYGTRRSPFSGKIKHHEGADFAMPAGSEVHVTADGIVKKVKRCRTYGLYVDVEHSKKVMTRYAHLSKVYVSEGQSVCAEQILGLVGSSGHSTGPHLHYEVRVDGRTIDPLRIMNIRLG
jgi:murein DD-endopeptidase MepM/ murein hydrolase activator NlpD